MAVRITVILSEAQANALLKVDDRAGWHSTPSQALQMADFKIMSAIISERKRVEESREEHE